MLASFLTPVLQPALLPAIGNIAVTLGQKSVIRSSNNYLIKSSDNKVIAGNASASQKTYRDIIQSSDDYLIISSDNEIIGVA